MVCVTIEVMFPKGLMVGVLSGRLHYMWCVHGISTVWVGPYQGDICSGGLGVGWTVQ